VEKLQRAVRVAGRSLLTPESRMANGALATSLVIAQERRRHCKPLRDVWFEINEGRQRFYIIERSNGGGEYRRTLPPGTDPDAVVPIVVPPGLAPATQLLTQMEGLLIKFQSTPQFMDEPTNEVLELEGGAPAQAALPGLLGQVAGIRQAIAPEHNRKLMDRVFTDLQSAPVNHARSGDFGLLWGPVRKARESIDALRDALRADLPAVAVLRLFQDVAEAAHAATLARGGSFDAANGRYAKMLVNLLEVSDRNPLHLVGFIPVLLLREGFYPDVLALAHRYFDQGEELIEQALDAPTRDEHGERLYRAAVPMFMAETAFKVMHGSVMFVPAANVAELAKLANISEEKLVRINDALLFALRDRGDEMLDGTRADLSKIAARQGEEAVNAKITSLIELRYFYPRVFRDCLRGQGVKPQD
jgi:hypothetical protein